MGKLPLYRFAGVPFFAKHSTAEVSAGSTSIEVPVDHPLGNFTHLAIFTQSVVVPRKY